MQLMQHYQLSTGSHKKTYESIGFTIYSVDDQHVNKKVDVDYFKYHASKARSPAFIKTRDNIGSYRLPAGTYVIVPSTFDPDLPGKFLLRLFTETPITRIEP